MSYQKWGKKCPQYLLGDFAFAIWDARQKMLFCARDHFEVKPFFYHSNPSKFVFASEIKGILSLPSITQEESKYWLMDYLMFQIENKINTYYKNVFRLPPAHTLTFTDGKLTIERYWRLEPSQELILKNENEYIEAFRDEFSRAVSCRLNSAYPISAELSGGMDSGAIAALARQLTQQNDGQLFAYSHALPLNEKIEEEYLPDERKVIDQLLKKANITNHEYVFHEGHSFLGTIGEVMKHLDEVPRVNFNLTSSLLHERATSNGSGVLLSGLGGDQMITYKGAGYMEELITNGQ